MFNTVRCRYNAVGFLKNPHNHNPNSSPVRARYEVSFVNSNADLYYVSLSAVRYVICYFELCHGIQLYMANAEGFVRLSYLK